MCFKTWRRCLGFSIDVWSTTIQCRIDLAIGLALGGFCRWGKLWGSWEKLFQLLWISKFILETEIKGECCWKILHDLQRKGWLPYNNPDIMIYWRQLIYSEPWKFLMLLSCQTKPAIYDIPSDILSLLYVEEWIFCELFNKKKGEIHKRNLLDDPKHPLHKNQQYQMWKESKKKNPTGLISHWKLKPQLCPACELILDFNKWTFTWLWGSNNKLPTQIDWIGSREYDQPLVLKRWHRKAGTTWAAHMNWVNMYRLQGGKISFSSLGIIELNGVNFKYLCLLWSCKLNKEVQSWIASVMFRVQSQTGACQLGYVYLEGNGGEMRES